MRSAVHKGMRTPFHSKQPESDQESFLILGEKEEIVFFFLLADGVPCVKRVTHSFHRIKAMVPIFWWE